MRRSGLTAGGRPLTFCAVVALGLGSAGVHQAGAATVVYSNVDNFDSYTDNGTTTALGGVDYTPLIADDITPAAGSAGMFVTDIAFSVVNTSGVTATVNPDLRFYAANGASGGPGTLLSTITSTPVTLDDGTFTVFDIVDPTGYFPLPATTFWAGLSFSDGGAATATPAELASFGQGIFDPVTPGSSADEFFASTVTSTFTTDNPTGNLESFGGSPLANLGWAFSVSAVPEPTSASLIGVAGLAALGRRRRRTGR